MNRINLAIFRKKVIKWNLDKFGLEFMGNNAERGLWQHSRGVVFSVVASFLALAWTKQEPLYWQRYIPLGTPLRLDPLITPDGRAEQLVICARLKQH